jgi:hypothetical protein
LYIADNLNIISSTNYTNADESLQMITALIDWGNKKFLVGVCYNSRGNLDELAKAFSLLQNNNPSDPP